MTGKSFSLSVPAKLILLRPGQHLYSKPMKRDSSRILIVGYGEMGHAIAHLLGKNHQLVFYDSRPATGLPTINTEQEAALADYIFFCVPASSHLELLTLLAPHLQKHCISISIAKGLDEQGRTPAQLFEQTFSGQHPYCLLYGPMISEEIRADRYAFAELGCDDLSIYRRVHKLFKGTKLYIKHSNDIVGISWSVILKNVYAIAFGIADELQLGDNMRGHLMMAAMAELTAIVKSLGGEGRTVQGYAGLGDMVTTATSAGSHHHALGRQLASGRWEDISGEGVHTLRMVEKYRLIDSQAYPLFALVRDIVVSPESIKSRMQSYLDQLGRVP